MFGNFQLSKLQSFKGSSILTLGGHAIAFLAVLAPGVLQILQ